jgi:hypothetical protein
MAAIGRLTLLVSIFASGACDPGRDADHTLAGRPRVNLEGVARVALGAGEVPTDEAVFQKPLDAVYWGDTIAVLDAASPWIRLFTVQGDFLGSVGARGEGPGEAEWPWGISLAGDTLLTLIHSRGWEYFDRGGNVMGTVRPTDPITGLLDVCGRSLGFIVPNDRRSPAFLALLEEDGTIADTVTVVGATRGRSRIYHAPMSASFGDGALFYNEGVGEGGALLTIDCAGRLVGSRPLPDSLGQGESIRPRPDGRPGMAIVGPEWPTPAGLAKAGPHYYWATHGIFEGDSVTILTRLGDDAGVSEVREVHGWYTLLDGSLSGDLLFSNVRTAGQAWSVGDVWGPEPMILSVRAADLF